MPCLQEFSQSWETDPGAGLHPHVPPATRQQPETWGALSGTPHAEPRQHPRGSREGGAVSHSCGRANGLASRSERSPQAAIWWGKKLQSQHLGTALGRAGPPICRQGLLVEGAEDGGRRPWFCPVSTVPIARGAGWYQNLFPSLLSQKAPWRTWRVPGAPQNHAERGRLRLQPLFPAGPPHPNPRLCTCLQPRGRLPPGPGPSG